MTQIHVEEVLTKLDNGAAVAIQYKDFWQYVDKKRTNKEKLMKLTAEAREDFFMRWKHGMEEMSLNWEFEYTLRHFLKLYEGEAIEAAPPAFQEPLRLRRAFEEYCNKIRVELNLFVRKQDLPKEVQEVADHFGGTVVSSQ